MLCSELTGKSGGSNWLDRLRSAKGFPAGDDLDLDHFLSQNPNSSSSESTQLNSNPSSESTRLPAESRAANPSRFGVRDRGLAGVVSNVLSELFFIGGSVENSELSGKRFPRKQTNPRIYVATSSNNVGTGNSNSSVHTDQRKKKINKLKKKKKKKKITTMDQKSSDFAPKFKPRVSSDSNSLTRANREIENDDGDEEEEGLEMDELKGYSRSEVTVIDTSVSSWKSEKIVFRRKNVWKVREKKGKSGSFGVKKRKTSNVDQARDLSSVEKRVKSSAQLSVEIDNGDQSLKQSSLGEGKNINEDSREDFCRVMTDDLNPTTVPFGVDSPHNLIHDFKKRSQFSSALKKMKRVGSSAMILSKSVQNERKITGNFSKNCFNKLGTKKQDELKSQYDL